AVREDGALPTGGAIQPLGDAHAQPLRRTRECQTVRGLDDQVDVIRLDRILRKSHPEPLPCRRERLEDDSPGFPRAQVRDTLENAHRDVDRRAAGDALPPHVRDAWAVSLRLPPRALPPPTPPRKDEHFLSRFAGLPHVSLRLSRLPPTPDTPPTPVRNTPPPRPSVTTSLHAVHGPEDRSEGR